jgi:hypothetical protein
MVRASPAGTAHRPGTGGGRAGTGGGRAGRAGSHRPGDRRESLAGLNAFYSTIHFPTPDLPAVYREFHRVLKPGAPLLPAFQSGDDPKHFTRAWDHDVDLTIYRRPPSTVTELLTEAGFRPMLTSVCEPPSRPGRPHAYVIAHRLPT